VGGFNAMIEKQKKLEGKVYVSTVLFSTESQVLHDRRDLGEIAPLTEEDYCVGGCTALMDALGDAIHHIGNVHKYARKEDVPDRTLFVITTDGMENASRRYSSREVKKMIQRQKEKYGWEFLFVAANIDAVETAAHIGIPKERAANYKQSADGTAVLFEAVGSAVTSMRCKSTVEPCWAEKLEK